jgi:hypothetical protein
VGPSVPNAPRLERFFARAFAQSPDARYGSVEELAGEFVLVSDAPGPLATAARTVAEVLRNPGELGETQDTVTNRLVRSSPTRDASSERAAEFAHVEDLEATEVDDRLSASAGGAGRTR